MRLAPPLSPRLHGYAPPPGPPGVLQSSQDYDIAHVLQRDFHILEITRLKTKTPPRAKCRQVEMSPSSAAQGVVEGNGAPRGAADANAEATLPVHDRILGCWAFKAAQATYAMKTTSKKT